MLPHVHPDLIYSHDIHSSPAVTYTLCSVQFHSLDLVFSVSVSITTTMTVYQQQVESGRKLSSLTNQQKRGEHTLSDLSGRIEA